MARELGTPDLLSQRPSSSFCWLPPENAEAGSPRPRGSQPDRLGERAEHPRSAPRPPVPGERPHARQQHVVLRAQPCEQALRAPSPPAPRDPGGEGVGGAGRGDGTLPGFPAVRPERPRRPKSRPT
ncbi:hypothetical protein [Streptomyces sp. 11x1]|uniref:hypothetical protein n=1 Tax=Streptomyces sp. 11x1 TaxID=3038642 RepID=UPI002930940B|nr:hypothetical protein [Streptomyces sp. 11x1]WNZ06938.1 hypothetical protein P8T65_04540 [Streptomyces sp. 11x1]